LNARNLASQTRLITGAHESDITRSVDAQVPGLLSGDGNSVALRGLRGGSALSIADVKRTFRNNLASKFARIAAHRPPKVDFPANDNPFRRVSLLAT